MTISIWLLTILLTCNAGLFLACWAALVRAQNILLEAMDLNVESSDILEQAHKLLQ